MYTRMISGDEKDYLALPARVRPRTRPGERRRVKNRINRRFRREGRSITVDFEDEDFDSETVLGPETDEEFWPEWPHERGCTCWDCRFDRRRADEEG